MGINIFNQPPQRAEMLEILLSHLGLPDSKNNTDECPVWDNLIELYCQTTQKASEILSPFLLDEFNY